MRAHYRKRIDDATKARLRDFIEKNSRPAADSDLAIKTIASVFSVHRNVVTSVCKEYGLRNFARGQ